MVFKALDDPEKIKSYDASIIWVEEATDLDYDTYLQLDLRARKPGIFNQIFYSYNPVDVRHWTVTDIIEAKDKTDIAVLHSTYQDNPFLPDSYVKRLLGLKEKDENYYRIYTLGLPGLVENLIYNNYKIESFNLGKDPDFYGLDLGFNDPNALIAGWVWDQKTYLKEMIYQTEQNPVDLIKSMDSLGIAKGPPIYCDHRTDVIDMLNKEGYNVYLADKDVHPGIMYVKSQSLVIHEESINLLKEIQRYKWMKDKNGKLLEKPVDYNDHIMDAMRYAIYSHRDRANFANDIITDIVGGTSLPSYYRS
jgi:phage terminase large subunit